jgi:hypothetical protein
LGVRSLARPQTAGRRPFGDAALGAGSAGAARARDPGRPHEGGPASLIEKTLHDVFGPVEDGRGPAASERDKDLRQVLDAVHFVRYAPQLGDYSEQVRALAARAAEVVRRWA